MKFPITGVEEADMLLERDPLALLIGMLLDQQFPMEWAFRGPWRLVSRLEGPLNAHTIAALSEDDVVAMFCAKPALHRYPAVMARRTRKICLHLIEHHDGDAAALWSDGANAETVAKRLAALPGYGPEKVKILIAILNKRLGVKLRGWRKVAAPFSDNKPRSAADVTSKARLEEVRAFKRDMKKRGKGKAD